MSESTNVHLPNEWSEKSGPSCENVRQQSAKVIEIDSKGSISSVAFLVDGKHIFGGGKDGKIRRWRVEDGVEVGTMMDAGSRVFNIAASRNGKWVVSVASNGKAMVWDAKTHEKKIEIKVHKTYKKRVRAVDVSPDGTKIATGSDEMIASVWSLLTGERLLDLFKHDDKVAAIKFSPDGRLIATATWDHDSVQVYGAENGGLVAAFPIRVDSVQNQSLSWADDSERLFAFSNDGTVSCLAVSSGVTLARWSIHTKGRSSFSAIISDRKFIATSTNSSVSFWDVTTQDPIGSAVVQHSSDIKSMAISHEHLLATCGGRTITLWNLCDVLPPLYCEGDASKRAVQNIDTKETCVEKTDGKLRPQENPRSKIARLEKIAQSLRRKLSENQPGRFTYQLCDQLARPQHADIKEEDNLERTAESLSAPEDGSEDKVAQLVETMKELRVQFSESQRKTDSLLRMIQECEGKRRCESLYAQGRVHGTAESPSLLEIANTLDKDLKTDKLTIDWLSELTHQCAKTINRTGSEVSNAEQQDEGTTAKENTYHIHIENVYISP